jgi:hypothetical protein
VAGDYQLVELANGSRTLYSASYGEKMHPGLGPEAEAELLYVRQLRICERLAAHAGEFVIWDVGLGGAANALAVLRAAQGVGGRLRVVSFDNTDEPLRLARENAAALKYPLGYEDALGDLLRTGRAEFGRGNLQVNWEFRRGDFPMWLAQGEAAPTPDAIFYDAFSPAKNPAMWTQALFDNLFRRLEPGRPCGLTTYSRSTLLRATLLLAGFFVGAGLATGRKEETTVAANAMELLDEPLNARWLERAMRSHSAEPLTEAVYRSGPLSEATRAKLRSCRQFQREAGA